MIRCHHFAHELTEGVWMGRTTPLSSDEIGWELCAAFTVPRPPDGVISVKYQCNKCGYLVEIPGMYRFFPDKSGFFHDPFDKNEVSSLFRDHLADHLAKTEAAAIFPVREEFDF